MEPHRKSVFFHVFFVVLHERCPSKCRFPAHDCSRSKPPFANAKSGVTAACQGDDIYMLSLARLLEESSILYMDFLPEMKFRTRCVGELEMSLKTDVS